METIKVAYRHASGRLEDFLVTLNPDGSVNKVENDADLFDVTDMLNSEIREKFKKLAWKKSENSYE